MAAAPAIGVALGAGHPQTSEWLRPKIKGPNLSLNVRKGPFTAFNATRSWANGFVGLDNFRQMLSHDPLFWQSLGFSVRWVVVEVGLQLLSGLVLALIVNETFIGRGLARGGDRPGNRRRQALHPRLDIECEIHGNGSGNLAVLGASQNPRWYERGLLHPHRHTIVDAVDADGMVAMPPAPRLGDDWNFAHIEEHTVDLW